MSPAGTASPSGSVADTALAAAAGAAAWPPVSVYRQRFQVAFDYPVVFTEGCFDPANPALAGVMAAGDEDAGRAGATATLRRRCVVFLDLGVATAWPRLIDAITAYFATRERMPVLAAPPKVMAGGEAIKNEPQLIGRMHDLILSAGIDRHSFVLAIGGGAFLDAVGLAAATAHRGVRLVRVPTTVLAQNDAGIGVKTAINMNGAKNQIGVFAPPWAVVNDTRFLDTLEPRDRIAGIAEAVKVALVRDPAFFTWLERSADALAVFEPVATATMIRCCAELHLEHIATAGDPFEQGNARPLDFGHWCAHKLETMSRHHLRHGEAVAIGIALDCRYSVLAGLLAPGQDDRIAVLLEHLGFRLWHSALGRRDGGGRPLVLAGLEEFREHLGGRLSVTLLTEPGRGREVDALDPVLIQASIDWLARREAP